MEESKGWILQYSILDEEHNTVWKMSLIQYSYVNTKTEGYLASS